MPRGDAKEKRMQRIAELVRENSTMSTKDLAVLLEVSEMTIRRDVSLLKKNKVLERSHGGVYMEPYHGGMKEDEVYDLRLSSVQNLGLKTRIARYAATLIEPNDLVFLDNGTTLSCIPEYLPHEFDFTMLCCNFALLAGTLNDPNIRKVMPGGYYHEEDQTFSSPQAAEFIRCHRANKAFIAASGIHQSLGITCINAHSVENKRAMIESSAQCILLSDSSKFGVVKSNHFADLDQIDMLITDAGITPDWKKYLEQLGIEVRIV